MHFERSFNITVSGSKRKDDKTSEQKKVEISQIDEVLFGISPLHFCVKIVWLIVGWEMAELYLLAARKEFKQKQNRKLRKYGAVWFIG